LRYIHRNKRDLTAKASNVKNNYIILISDCHSTPSDQIQRVVKSCHLFSGSEVNHTQIHIAPANASFAGILGEPVFLSIIPGD
jgi:23S rRNA G2445 N2-methylase RlmL